MVVPRTVKRCRKTLFPAVELELIRCNKYYVSDSELSPNEEKELSGNWSSTKSFIGDSRLF